MAGSARTRARSHRGALVDAPFSTTPGSPLPRVLAQRRAPAHTAQSGVAYVPLWDSCCRSRSEEHTSELQSHLNLVCRLLLEKKKSSLTSTRNQTLSRV